MSFMESEKSYSQKLKVKWWLWGYRSCFGGWKGSIGKDLSVEAKKELCARTTKLWSDKPVSYIIITAGNSYMLGERI